MEEILDCFLVFLAVPIRSFESLVKEISQYNMYNTTIVDVCSVKSFPITIFRSKTYRPMSEKKKQNIRFRKLKYVFE